MFENIPKVKIGIVAVSRDCFPESLSVNRRKALVDAYKAKYEAEDIYECPVCIVESEIHMVQALEDIKKEGCNALVVYLGNFGPEISETLLAKHFEGPKMFVAAAEETGNDLVSGRGDAYCGMLNASYNLQLRNIKAYIPEYPVGTAAECADMIHDFLPIARTVIGLSDLKIISFGPRPLNFLACNAPIKQLYNLGVEIEENSELDLFEAFNKHAGDPRIAEVAADMAAELGEGNKKPEILAKLAQYELTLSDWIRDHRGCRKYVAIAGKCWPAFQTQFGFVPCYVNSRLTGRGIPVSCEVDIYGALSEFIGTCISQDAVTLCIKHRHNLISHIGSLYNLFHLVALSVQHWLLSNRIELRLLLLAFVRHRGKDLDALFTALDVSAKLVFPVTVSRYQSGIRFLHRYEQRIVKAIIMEFGHGC